MSLSVTGVGVTHAHAGRIVTVSNMNDQPVDDNFKELVCKTVKDSRDILEALLNNDSGVDMDQEVIALCVALNRMPGVQTDSSCCGHGNRPYGIFFTVKDQEDLVPICYYLDPCHVGYTGWSVTARSDCGMSPISFLLEGPVGAYAASEDIARHINEWVDGLEETDASE